MILDLFRKAVGQARESSHGHPHREILAFHVAGRDEFLFGLAQSNDLLTPGADCRAVALLPLGILAVVLHELRVVDLISEGVDDRVEVDLVAVCG